MGVLPTCSSTESSIIVGVLQYLCSESRAECPAKADCRPRGTESSRESVRPCVSTRLDPSIVGYLAAELSKNTCWHCAVHMGRLQNLQLHRTLSSTTWIWYRVQLVRLLQFSLFALFDTLDSTLLLAYNVPRSIVLSLAIIECILA